MMKKMKDSMKNFVFTKFGPQVFTWVFGHPCEERNCVNSKECRRIYLETGESVCLNIMETNVEVRLYKVLKWSVYDDTSAEYVDGDMSKAQAETLCAELNSNRSDDVEYTVASYIVHLPVGDLRIQAES